MGQGLQGLLPIDHLAGLIIFDISVKGGGMASYQVKGLLETWQDLLGKKSDFDGFCIYISELLVCLFVCLFVCLVGWLVGWLFVLGTG